MMSYNAKNYMTDGGNRLVIGGTLEVEDGATVIGIEGASLPDATTTTKGGVKMGTPVPDSAAVDVAGVNTALNKLIGSLVTAGVIGAVPAITAQPEDASAAAGATVSFSVTATGTGTLTYQWQSKTSGASEYTNTSATGYNTKKLSIEAQAVRNGASYRCVVSDAFGNSVTSNGATLTVTE